MLLAREYTIKNNNGGGIGVIYYFGEDWMKRFNEGR